MDCLADIDMFNKFPTGHKKWEVLKTTRRISYRLKELKEGHIFGVEGLKEGLK